MKFNSIMAAAISAAALCGLSAQAEETWKDLGTGQLRDDVITSPWVIDTFYEFPVQVQESEQTPGRYRLVNAYENCTRVGPAFPEGHTNYLVIDASDPKHVYIEPGGTNYYVGQDQHLIIWSIADDYYNNKYGDWVQADKEGVCGTLADGVISFPRKSVLFFPAEDMLDFTVTKEIYDWVWQQCNGSGMFRLLLPGVPETDVRVDMIGISSSSDKVEYTLTLDKDITSVRYAVFPGKYEDDMAARIIDGKVEYQSATASGNVTVDYAEDGVFTFVAVPFVGDKAWQPAYITREWAYSQKEWKDVGDAMFTEAILSSNGANTPYEEETITVPLQQNVEKPWLIRLVDTYGPDRYRYATQSNYDTSVKHYITLDCGLYDNVRVLRSGEIGLRFMTSYTMEAWSVADRAINDENFTEVLVNLYKEENGGKLPTGHYDKGAGVITFDKKALSFRCSVAPTTWYPANENGHAKIVLPSGLDMTEDPSVSGVETVEVAGTDAPAEYYTIDGVRVDAPSAPGVYIVRKGSRSFKTVIR